MYILVVESRACPDGSDEYLFIYSYEGFTLIRIIASDDAENYDAT
jgi:hypothetical protein